MLSPLLIGGIAYETLEVQPCVITSSLNADASKLLVTIECPTEGAEIYYTDDLSIPCDKDEYRYSKPFELDILEENDYMPYISAVAFEEGKNSALVVKQVGVRGNEVLPSVSPSAGTVRPGTDVTLSGKASGATLYYTTDGSEPDMNVKETTGSTYVVVPDKGEEAVAKFTVEDKLTLRAAIMNDHYTSVIVSFDFTTGANAGSGNAAITTTLSAGAYFVKVFSDSSFGAETYRLKFAKNASESMDFSEVALARTVLAQESPYAYEYVNAYKEGLNAGGSDFMVTEYLSRWLGPIDEAVEPYPERYLHPADPDDPNFKKYEEYHPENLPSVALQNAIWLPSQNDCGREAFEKHMKNAIYCYGSVVVTYESSSGGTSGETSAHLYDTVTNSLNHAVQIIGWDDTIAKDLFENDFGTPSRDGGWIIKNSWGTGSGAGGYYYMSYDTLSLSYDSFSSLYQVDELLGEYNRQYVHDELGIHTSREVNSSSVYIKSRFTAQSDETLKAVAFTSCSADCDYEVYVNADISEDDGLGARVAKGSRVYPGYYTIKLGDGVKLQAGSQFDVTVRLESRTGAKIKYGYEESDVDSGQVAVIDLNETFVSMDGKAWSDMAIENKAVTVRAFTKDESLGNSYEVIGTQAEKYNDDKYVAMRKRIEEKVKAEPAANRSENRTASGAPSGVRLSNVSLGVPAQAPNDDSLPASFDLREIGVKSSVKSQASLGTCWAFAAMGSVESVYMRNCNLPQTENSVALGESAAKLELTTDMPRQVYTARAVAATSEGDSSNIRWSFSGDLDSISILSTASRSGETVSLFEAHKRGNIITTASCDYANIRPAEVRITITDNFTKKDDEPNKKEPSANAGESSNTQGATLATKIELEIGDARPTMSNAGRMLEKHIAEGRFSVYSSGDALMLTSADKNGRLELDGKLDIAFLEKCGVNRLVFKQRGVSAELTLEQLKAHSSGVVIELDVTEDKAPNAVSRTVKLSAPNDLKLSLTFELEGEPSLPSVRLSQNNGGWYVVDDGIQKLQSVKRGGKVTRIAITAPLSGGTYAVTTR